MSAVFFFLFFFSFFFPFLFLLLLLLNSRSTCTVAKELIHSKGSGSFEMVACVVRYPRYVCTWNDVHSKSANEKPGITAEGIFDGEHNNVSDNEAGECKDQEWEAESVLVRDVCGA